VLQQTFQDWQCVISDDASTDKSVEIAREFEKKDTRFKVLTHEKNVGAANNWNRAKENNNSFATKILCADDYLLKDAIVPLINAPKVDSLLFFSVIISTFSLLKFTKIPAPIIALFVIILGFFFH
jgi:glycosyltransferase involved in cell wall biosynthesis